MTRTAWAAAAAMPALLLLGACKTDSPLMARSGDPVADAGLTLEVSPGDTVTLDGSGSHDPRGGRLTWEWTQTGGAEVELDNPAAVQPRFTAPLTRGALQFQLVVRTASGLASDPSTVEIVVLNGAPVAVAGEDRAAVAGSRVELDGSASSDPNGDPLSFTWSQTGGTAVDVETDGPVATFTAPDRGVLEFTLVVNDGVEDSEPSLVRIGVDNAPPTADAGDDQEVHPGAMVTLDGSRSTDPEGAPLLFAWTQTGGAAVELMDAAAAQARFVAPAERGALTFQLIVSDGVLDGAPATVMVHVANRAPVAAAGDDQFVDGGAEVTLDGTASSDPDADELSFRWTQVGGPAVELTGADGPTPSFTAPPGAEVYAFGLIVNDGTADSAQSDVHVVVDNRAPVIVTETEIPAEPGAAVVLDASRSFDPDGDELSFLWVQTGGDEVAPADLAGATLEFTAPDRRSRLDFTLTVSDGLVDAGPVAVVVQVGNSAPVADAGPDARVEPGARAFLDGTASSDPDGDELAFLWTQTSGTPLAPSDPMTASVSVLTPPGPGTWCYALVVNDGFTDSAPDEACVRTDNTNAPPAANAGRDINVHVRARAVLDGTGSMDPDGDVLSLQWRQVSGTMVALTTLEAGIAEFRAPGAPEVLVFELTASDGTLESTDRVRVNVLNGAPIADAGPDQELDGNTAAQLDGRGSSDPDGDDLTFEWAQIAGDPVTLSDLTARAPTFVAPPRRQTTTFRLTVHDGTTSGTDTVNVVVRNHQPTADAGRDFAPHVRSVVELDGTASRDLDGDALTFAWRQLNGPTVVLSNPAAARPTFVAPAQLTTLSFGLVVTDGIEPSAEDTVLVTISNAAPIARAGTARAVHVATQVEADGSGSSDPDGDPITYLWRQVAGPPVLLSCTTCARPSFLAPAFPSRLTLELVVNDGLIDSAPSTVRYGIENNPPVANAGPNRTVDQGNSTTVGGENFDPDGDAITCTWTQTAGPSVTITSASSCNTRLGPFPRDVFHQFELRVTDEFGASATDRVDVNVVD